MPTYKQWGFTDVVNTVAALGTGVAYWQMTGDLGAVIEIDFGYKVSLKTIACQEIQGCMGDYAIVASNTPASSMADAYVEANGDVEVSPFTDSVTQQLGQGGSIYTRTPPFNLGQFLGPVKYRYYRLILIGPGKPSVDDGGNRLPA